METKKVIRFCVYGCLLLAFILTTIQAFQNLLSENTGFSSTEVHESIKMPSMTICPAGTQTDIRDTSINASIILESLQDIPINVSITLQSSDGYRFSIAEYSISGDH